MLHGIKHLNKGNCIMRSSLKRSNTVLIVTEKETKERLEAQPLIYRLINGVGWESASYKVRSAINHELSYLEGTAFRSVRM